MTVEIIKCVVEIVDSILCAIAKEIGIFNYLRLSDFAYIYFVLH